MSLTSDLPDVSAAVTVSELEANNNQLNQAEKSRNNSRRNPRSTQLLMLIGVLFVFATNALRWARAGEDPDLWWHVRAGNWIVQHGGLPATDPYSWTAAGKPWVVYHWLFSVMLAKIFDGWGLEGTLALVTLLTLTIMLALTALFSRYTTVTRAMILAGTVQVGMFSFRGPRPWLFSILFFILELWLLLRACEDAQPKWLIPIAPLFALWANLHVEFVFGLGLAGLFALQQTSAKVALGSTETGRRLQAKWLWAVVLGSILATMANPYGWRLYGVVLQYATQSAPYQVVQEMQPMGFRQFDDWAVLGLVCAAWFALGKATKRPAALTAMLVVACWFGFRAGRGVWLPAITSALLLAYLRGGKGDSGARFPRSYWMTAAAAVLIFALGEFSGFGRTEAALQKSTAEHYPVQAAAFIEQNHLAGPIYNSYGWGGYLIWRLPEMQVSIDGRANLYGDDRVIRSAKTMAGSRDWTDDPELRKAKVVVAEDDSPLASILRGESRFRLLYRDKVAAVFQAR